MVIFMEKKAESGKKGVIFLLLILGLLGFIFLLVNEGDFNGSNSITGDVVRGLKNCRNVQVPYQIEETYDYYLKSEVTDSHLEEKLDLFGKGIFSEGIINLKNMDNEAGWFVVTFNWKTLNNEKKDSIRHYIKPDETVEFKSIYDNKLGEDIKFTYNYISEPVQKTRMVTRYTTERKCS